MTYATELLNGLYNATKEGKVNWVESSSNEAYFAKVGDKKVEIVAPVTDSRRLMMQAIQNQPSITSAFSSITIKKAIPIDQWRIIVYGDDGKVTLEIGESMVKNELEEIGIKSNVRFQYIYEYASRRNDGKSEKIVSEILKELQ